MVDQQLRQSRIGGSEVAAIFGADEFGKDEFSVWYDKKGGGERAAPDLRMKMGKAMERGILDLYTVMTGQAVEYHDRTIAHPSRPYMAATPDAFLINQNKGVDAKLVFWDQRRVWGETANDIPQRVIMQCWWYEAAFDVDQWDICALMLGTGEPVIYTIERDLEVEREMLAQVEAWHAKYILGDEVPPYGRSPDAAAWLQKIYPDDHRPNMRAADEQEAALLSEYVELRVMQKVMKARQAEMETALKAAIKSNEGLEWPEGKFTWRKAKDRDRTDWQSLAIALLYNFVKDEAERAKHIADHTYPQLGLRRIRVDHPALRKPASDEEEAA